MTPKTSWINPVPLARPESVTAAAARERLQRVRKDLETKLTVKDESITELKAELSEKAKQLEATEDLLTQHKVRSAEQIAELSAKLARLNESSVLAQASLQKLRDQFSSTATIVDSYARAFAKLQKASQLALVNGDNKRKLRDKRKELRDKLLDTLSKTMELKAKE